jgi:virginiamycin B lyase
LAIGVSVTGCSQTLADASPVTIPAGAVKEFTITSESTNLTSLAVDPERNIWFTETNPGRIARISPMGVTTGEFALPFGVGIQPAGPESYSEPDGLALGADGNMWFTDRGTNKEGKSFVGYVTPAGMIKEFPIPTPSRVPIGIAPGFKHDMWFTEEASIGQIGHVTEAGTVTEFLVSGSNGEYLNDQPVAIAQGADGNMWFTDLSLDLNGKYDIGQITPAGVVTLFPIPVPYRAPEAIALGADGNMWFTQSPATIGRITPAGVVSEVAVSSVGESYSGLALGPDGDIWFTGSPNVFGRITPAGVVTDFSQSSASSLPLALVRGGEGDLWYAEGSHIGRLVTPLAPTGEAPPALSGQAVEGQALSVSAGSWAHDPSTFEYQWQICDAFGAGCTSVAGQNEASHRLTAGDVGHTLRALVTASNIGGATAAMSIVSAVVQAAPHGPLLVPKPLPTGEPLPVVGSAMTWNFGWARTYTIVESLVVRGVPAGGVVEVTCHGRGCAFARWRSDAATRRSACKRGKCKALYPKLAHGEASLARLFKSRHLKVGAHVIVSVLKAGWIGKSFVFTMRANKPPHVQITCLGSGPSNPTGEC